MLADPGAELLPWIEAGRPLPLGRAHLGGNRHLERRAEDLAHRRADLPCCAEEGLVLGVVDGRQDHDRLTLRLTLRPQGLEQGWANPRNGQVAGQVVEPEQGRATVLDHLLGGEQVGQRPGRGRDEENGLGLHPGGRGECRPRLPGVGGAGDEHEVIGSKGLVEPGIDVSLDVGGRRLAHPVRGGDR